MIKSILNKIFKEDKPNLSKQDKVEIKGSLGELRQEFRLDRLERNKYRVISNIIIPNKGKTTQIDHLVISNYGIFVIENKNFIGDIYGSEYDKTWTQVIGKSRNIFYNPVAQNYGHIKALENIIGTGKDIYSIIVFGDKSLLKKIDISSNNVKVINERDLISTITSYTVEVLTNEEVKEYLNKVLSSMASIRQDIKSHIKNIKSTLEDKNKICPKCNSELVKRSGKYGEFLGCKSYPKCKYTYKL